MINTNYAMRTRYITLLSFLLITSFFVSAQKDVTTFLGIPVDGTKSAMKQKLINKGFIPTKVAGEDYLEGEFNGTEVEVHIVTNNNKVFRIFLLDKYGLDESEIKIRFNKLISQFENNERYSDQNGFSEVIPEDERISYEMNVNKKIYEESFIQKTKGFDDKSIEDLVNEQLKKEYSDSELQNPTEEILNRKFSLTFMHKLSIATKKIVWFRILESYGKYYIAMYYDNVYNQANGEDL